MLIISHTCVKNSIGFYCAGIQGFTFKRNFGRAELIRNCSSGVTGCNNIYNGWCQFIRAARSMHGEMWIYSRKANTKVLDVDIYVYYQYLMDLNMREYQTVKLGKGLS